MAERLAAFTAAGSPAALEAAYFNALVLMLDRYFVHRVRMVTGTDGTPLNELEMLADSLMGNGGTLRPINVIKYDADASVLGLKIGDPIALCADDFERLASAVFAELEAKFH